MRTHFPEAEMSAPPMGILGRAGVANRRYHTAPARYAGPVATIGSFSIAGEDIPFEDRQDAGQRLVSSLEAFRFQSDVVVIGIPRGGIIVAAEVARLLEAPLGAWVAKKLRSPHDPDRAIGSLGQDGEMLVDEETIHTMRIPHSYLIQEVRAQRAEVARRASLYASACPEIELAGKRVILVDDGLSSGCTMRAALHGVKHFRPASITVAAPVGPTHAVTMLAKETNDIKVLETPLGFGEISRSYVHFREVTDNDVMTALNEQATMALLKVA